jgi:hypothetical protein
MGDFRGEGVRAAGSLVLADSVTRIDDAAGRVIVTGSHGGLYAAYLVAAIGAGGAIANDAGVGLDDAGVAGLDLLQEAGVPAAAVDHRSAAIGDAAATLEGRLSRVNALAAERGCQPGMDARTAADLLAARPASAKQLPPHREARTLVHTTASGVPVWALDSVALVDDSDARHILVTGSHGALLGGRPATALKRPALAAVFNDAGAGPDGRGRTRLPELDRRGIPAATVDANSARIGDGRSTYESGVISAVNQVAADLGAHAGQTTRRFVETIAGTDAKDEQ